ncbi:MAG: serine/threonine protein kinase [Pirellulales bacterium]|nr:serine/threonine protein kinase [Pirellulales bacterium]
MEARKTFRSSALASGLIATADLDAAIAALRSEPLGSEAVSSPLASAAQAQTAAKEQLEITDRQLADKLVEMNKLTRFQATQLLAGYSVLHLREYTILEAIGHGGMGAVFKAEHKFMGRIVAVKVLPQHKETPETTASFLHEIRAQARLSHENLVHAFDAGYEGKRYFLVTEYVPGSDLRKYVKQRGPLSMNEAARIVSQAARGLAHAHSQGLIHRDIKPGNLLVTPDGKVKVSDLGLAGWLGDAEKDPRFGKIVGTADYLSPEQILTPQGVTPTSDVYSLGCTLYYSVTGKVPFPGGTTRDKAKRHLEDMPLHPRRLNPALTDNFVDVIADMMDKDPKRRVQSADEVIRRLEPWVNQRIDEQHIAADSRWSSPDEPVVAAGSETESGEELSAAPEPNWHFDEGLSQASQSLQGTEPFAAADEETLRVHSSSSWLAPIKTQVRPLAVLLGAIAISAIVLLLIVFVSALVR